MPKTQLPDLIKKLVGPGKLTGEEVQRRGGISAGHVSDLKNGLRKPMEMRCETVLRLAKGLGESPITVFKAIIGQLEHGLQDETLTQILSDFSRLPHKDREELAFLIKSLRDEVGKRLHRNT